MSPNRCLNKSFNSTLVQLKGGRVMRGGEEMQSFNSTLVQLKDCQTIIRAPIHKSFNSTLVQLKDDKMAYQLWSNNVSILPQFN